ncbi:hypothetical protein ABZ707_32155 [Streptomyces sp. NPDC006923]
MTTAMRKRPDTPACAAAPIPYAPTREQTALDPCPGGRGGADA